MKIVIKINLKKILNTLKIRKAKNKEQKFYYKIM